MSYKGQSYLLFSFMCVLSLIISLVTWIVVKNKWPMNAMIGMYTPLGVIFIENVVFLIYTIVMYYKYEKYQPMLPVYSTNPFEN